MTHLIEFSTATSETIIQTLCKRLDAIRVSKNISQANLATQAGVSRSTLTRLADGKPISLDSFVRVMQALQLTEHLAALLPDPGVRPVDRVRRSGTERQRASRQRHQRNEWTWGDSEEDK